MRIKEPVTYWEIVDVELGYTFIAYSPQTRDDYENGVKLLNHRAIVKEVKPK
jgi:hypothetical protein